jgi:hypothetical protein
MPIVTLRHVVVGAAKADFVKHSIRVALDLPLTDETLALRSKLAFLAMEKESITVTLESAQLPLFDDKPASDSDTVTLSTKDQSVTMSAQAFEQAAERISDFTREVLNADESETDSTPWRKTKWEKKVERANKKTARKNKK